MNLSHTVDYFFEKNSDSRMRTKLFQSQNLLGCGGDRALTN